MVNACGADARVLCARTATFEGPRAEAILAGCREAGIGLGSSPPATSADRTG
jgi:hypothetical protein